MKKTLTLLILLFTTLFSANAEEITVWEGSLAGNLQITKGSDLFNKLTGNGVGQANLAVGDVLTIYYTGAKVEIEENGDSFSQDWKTFLSKIWIQDSEFTTYSSDITGPYDDKLFLEDGSKDIFVKQAFIDAINGSGLAFQIGGNTENLKITKLSVTKSDAHIPGYEMLYNGECHITYTYNSVAADYGEGCFPIAWGKITYPAPKRALKNLNTGDKVHIIWDNGNAEWLAKNWNPGKIALVSVFNGDGNKKIGSHNVTISSSDNPKEKSFTLTDEDITTIQANDLVISGYWYNLTKAYVEHPTRFVSVTTSAEGLATFSNASEAVDCSWFESLGIRAYKAEISGDRIVTTQVTDAVPAGTGLILQGSSSTTYKLPFAASADAIVGNVLEPTDGSAITGYVLGKVGGNVGFYRVTNKEVVAGKAYIPATFGSARAFSIDFLGNDVTGIEETLQSTATPQAATYNLMGQRVAANQKGFVIINGKKYINK